MNNRYINEVEKMAKTSKKLIDKGYVLLSDVSSPSVSFFNDTSVELAISKAKDGGKVNGKVQMGMDDGETPHPDFMQYMSGRDAVVATPDKDKNGRPLGIAGKGYIRYGVDDRLPLHIYRSVAKQPYTAAAMRFLKDIVYGKGILLLYKTSEYHDGYMRNISMPFQQAGDWLVGKIASLRKEIENGSEETKTNLLREDTTFINWPASGQAEKISYRVAAPVPKPSDHVDYSNIGTKQWRLKRLQEDYATWLDTSESLSRFLENSDLDELYAQCVSDDQHLDLFTIILSLEQGRRGFWDPEITKVQALKQTGVRLEEMDDNCKINNIYYSDMLLYSIRDIYRPDNIVSYPLLNNESMIQDLRTYIKANQKTPVGERQLHYAIMGRYPCGFSNYYEQPAWWSIYSSLVYQYVSTMIYDKAVAKKNSTMWGKLIYINNNYLQQYYADNQATTPDQKKEKRDELISSINAFFRERRNNGKTCTLDSFIAPGTNTVIKAIEIVDVPQPSAASASMEEIEACANLISCTFGVHTSLACSFGKNASSGGTDKREAYALKQAMMSPRQRKICSILNKVFKFNRWDSHLVAEVGREVLSTLDRSKTGIVELNTGEAE